MQFDAALFARHRTCGTFSPQRGGRGASPHHLHVELTESVLALAGAECQLRRLRREGIQLHIDDFGTGYSSGFDLAQGFFLSRPLAAEAVPGVILEGPQADAGAQKPVRR